MTRDKALIEEVFTPSKERSAPVILKFQNGDLHASQKDTALYFPVKSDQDKKKRAVVITSGSVYSGIVGEGGVATGLTDTYLCVRNKKTNKVRILPVDQAKLINHVHQDKEKTSYAALSKENAFALAVRNFGGRKDMRYLTNQERNKVSIDVVKDQLETTVEDSAVLDTTDPVVTAENNLERIRPQFNKDATSLENVFNLYDVIPLDLIDRLDEEAQVMMSTEVEDIPISSEYLTSIIQSLKSGPQSNQALLKLKIIIYMDALQSLIKSKAKALKRIELSKITEKVENDVRERFTSEHSLNKLRTSFSNEKALCYYLVLAFLISESYELDMDVVSQEVGMPKTKILQLAPLVNAKQKGTKTLRLILPSDVKPINFAYSRKRKK